MVSDCMLKPMWDSVGCLRVEVYWSMGDWIQTPAWILLSLSLKAFNYFEKISLIGVWNWFAAQDTIHFVDSVNSLWKSKGCICFQPVLWLSKHLLQNKTKSLIKSSINCHTNTNLFTWHKISIKAMCVGHVQQKKPKMNWGIPSKSNKNLILKDSR